MSSHHFLFEEEENEEKRLLRLERQQSIELANFDSSGPSGGRRPRGNSQGNRSFTVLPQESEDGEDKDVSSPHALLDPHTVKNPLSSGIGALRVAPRGREGSGGSLSPSRVNLGDEELAETTADNNADEGEDDDDDDEDVLGVTNSIIWLCVVSLLISFLSDAIVNTIEDASKGTNLSNVFLAAIVVPIVGNAAEHTSAVVFGMKNRLNLALAIAVGSATQIGLFLLPVVVLLGWMTGAPMSLNYEVYEVVSLTLTVLLVGFVLTKGRSTWLDGVTLIGAYAIICGGFWSHGSESDL